MPSRPPTGGPRLGRDRSAQLQVHFADVLQGGALAAVGMVAVREAATAFILPIRDALQYELTARSGDPGDRVYKVVRLRDLAGSRLRLSEYRPGGSSDLHHATEAQMGCDRPLDRL